MTQTETVQIGNSSVKMIEIKSLGAFFAVTPSKTLVTAPSLRGGGMDKGNIGEVTAPKSQQALNEINLVLNTNFRYENFSGR